MTHLRCLVAPAAAALLGFAAVAYAQDPTDAVAVATDPTIEALVGLLRGGGLPAVLALVAWWARGLAATGIPVVIQLHPEDRRLLRRLARDDGDDA